MNSTKLSENSLNKMYSPKLSYNDLCMVFKNSYPTITNGYYSNDDKKTK